MTLPNLLTLLRIALVPPFVYMISEGWFGTALIVFGVAGLSDYADGYLARRLNQQSKLGQILDPLADKLLTTAAFVVMAIPRGDFAPIPIWLAVAVVARDVLILVGALAMYLSVGYTEFKPSLLGKVNTFLEIVLIVGFLGAHTANVLLSLLPVGYFIVVVSVVLSGSGYLYQGLRILRGDRPGERAEAESE